MPSFSRFHNKRRGVTLLILTVSIVAAVIGMSVVIPRIEAETRRKKEEQLRFVLGEFKRAVSKFYLQNKRQPTSIGELLCGPNQNRFLRRKYVDPITGKAEWAFEAEASGSAVIIHSLSDEKSLSGAPYKSFR